MCQNALITLRVDSATLSGLFRFGIPDFEDFIDGRCSLSYTEQHEVRAQLEYKGAYFLLDAAPDAKVQIVHPNMKYSLPNDLSDQARMFANDARDFLYSADSLARRSEIRWENGKVGLPIVLLVTHAIELAIKSYLIDFANFVSRSHKLLDLYDQCRKFDCEKHIELADSEYWILDRLGRITDKAYHKYREVGGEEVLEFRDRLFTIAEKIVRLSRPYIRSPKGPIGGNIHLVYVVPAGSASPPKRPLINP
jgi:HEPN domain-containing protein